MAAGARQRAGGEYHVDRARRVEEMAYRIGEPREVAQDLDVEDTGIEVRAEGGGILRVSAEIVVMRLGQRWNDVAAGEVEGAACVGRPNERQLSVDDKGRAIREAVAVKPAAVDQGVRDLLDRADVRQS